MHIFTYLTWVSFHKIYIFRNFILFAQTVTRLEHHLATLCTAWGGCAVGSEWLGVLRIVEGKVAGLTEAAVE